jgi:rhamnulokinase
MTTAVAAVDLGASSGRVVVARFPRQGPQLQEVHRFANVPVRAGGPLRWDVLRLYRGTVEGLREAVRRSGPLDGVGVDSWAVDYGLLDADGELLGNPVCYREPGTDAALAAVLEILGEEALYEASGMQLQPFNTLFQLLARRDSAQARAARQLLLIPDLLTYWLSGDRGAEVTNASTTQLLDPRTRQWSEVLAAKLSVPAGLLAPLRRSGDHRGPVREDLGQPRPPLALTVPSHDTAAAVAGIPATSDDFAFVCTGTWALVGLELTAPVISEAARLANFTNEAGVDGTTRFLRNVTGFWLLQECVRHWTAAGMNVDAAALTRAAADEPPLGAVIDVQDPEFAPPGDMPARVRAAARRTSGVTPSTPSAVTRCILDSVALAVRHALRAAVEIAGHPVRVVHLVGGGVATPLFCQDIADACQLPVLAGPTEAASWGNALAQGRALGVVRDSLEESRALVARAAAPGRYAPRSEESDWQRADALVAAARGGSA